MDRNTIRDKDLKILDKINQIRKQDERLERSKTIVSKLLTISFLVFLLIIAFKLLTEEDDKDFTSRYKIPLKEQNNRGGSKVAEKDTPPVPSASQVSPEVSMTIKGPEKNKTAGESQTGAAVAVTESNPDRRTSLKVKEIAERERKKPSKKISSVEKMTATPGKSEGKGRRLAKTDKAVSDIYVARAVVCKEVKDRQPIDAQSRFSMSDDNTPMVWMDARASTLPQTVKHIYFHNQKKYCEVPLAVKYPRMRTWSYVTLDDPKTIGNWTVHIVAESGNLLKKVEFEMVP